MFGTVAKLRGKRGAESMLRVWTRALFVGFDGHVSTTIYRAVDEPDTYWLTAVFEDEDSYRANASSPEQHRRWQQMRSVLESDPEWHDGNVLFHGNDPENMPAVPPSRAGA